MRTGLSGSDLPDPANNLGSFIQVTRRAEFAASLAAGSAKQFVLPLSITGTFLVPILYLSIPHVQRPWLWRARFLVFAFITWFNYGIATTTSSASPAGAYASGLVCAWGIVWSARLMIWERVQWTAARVQRRRKGPRGRAGASGNGNGNGCGHTEKAMRTIERQKAPDESIAACIGDGEYEYYWQSYPHEGSFLARMSWVTDLVTSFRGSGWNWTPNCYPHFRAPGHVQHSEPVDLSSIPISSKYGFSRSTTYTSFLRSHLQTISLGYILLDFIGVFMAKDPYFILGPESSTDFNNGLSPYLSTLPPFLLELYRSALSFVGVVAALAMCFNVDHLIRVYLLSGTTSEMWQHPTIFGSFDAVLERGLTGLWGSWWHQTFRAGFEAPTAWMVRNGYLPAPRGKNGYWTKMVGALLAFSQSGFLHAAGSFTAVPDSRPWEPFMFFVLQYLGIVTQEASSAGLKMLLDPDVKIPRTWRRLGNLLFVVMWLHFTRWALIDDFARCGLWLFEPVPFSLARGLGMGKPGDTVWRWGDQLPGLYLGKHWWESGIRI